MATTRAESEEEPRDRVEKTFELLAAAKKSELGSDYWLATEHFLEAHELLKALAEEQNEKVAVASKDENDGSSNTSNGESVNTLEELRSIAALFSSKAADYWKQSRHSLIRAMEQERNRDETQKTTGSGGGAGVGSEAGTNKTTACLCESLDDDEARARNRSFSVLFSRPVHDAAAEAENPKPPIPGTGSNSSEEAGAPVPRAPIAPAAPGCETGSDDRPHRQLADEDDLEARLRTLNKSLPSGFKSTDERVSDLHEGMNKLGMSAYTQKKSPFANFDDELPKSEDEQIDEIMAMARDEAMLETTHHAAESEKGTRQRTTAGNDSDDDDGFDPSDEDSLDSEGDELLDDNQLAMKTIQKQVARARAKLAELGALLDEARTKRAKEDMDEEEAVFENDCEDDSGDDSSHRDIQKHDVAFLMIKGKRKLKGARRDMKKALAEWDEMIL